MFCSKCGFQSNGGEKFCRNCGNLLSDEQFQSNYQNQTLASDGQNMDQQSIIQQPINQPQVNQGFENNSYNQPYQNNNGLNSRYINKGSNPDMKKWAILSIVIPVVALVWYWFIGLSFYLAVLIAAVGFNFAKKGEMADTKLAKIGKILNIVLVVFAVIMLILSIILILGS